MKIYESLIRESIKLSQQAREKGNHPFGALLAIDEKIILTAENTVNTECSPIAHAETNLVQKAIRSLTLQEIAEATLYTSCEPCAMCTGTIYWAGIRKIVFALSASELAEIAGGDFLIPCRELFSKAGDKVEVHGPNLSFEAIAVHNDFWK